MTDIINTEYNQLLEDLKQHIIQSRYKAASALNHELIMLYYNIGSEILKRQRIQGWGSKVIDTLSKDLTSSFPEMKGFGIRNLKYMRLFAETYPDDQFVQQVAAQLPWGHNVYLLDLVKNQEERLFYMQKAIEHNWSRSVLVNQIELNLYHRQGKAINNFQANLPVSQSALAIQTLKDPYVFDFLSLGDEAQEREMEKSIAQHIQKFLLELGEGFAFVGRQYHLEVGQQDFYIDLLFYHLKLRSYIVIELKDKEFKPEYAGKMNFYITAVDKLLKHPTDNPTIGLILCKTKNNIVAEWSLQDVKKPIGLSEYQFSKILPANLESALPSIETLERKLASFDGTA